MGKNIKYRWLLSQTSIKKLNEKKTEVKLLKSAGKCFVSAADMRIIYHTYIQKYISKLSLF